MEIFILALITGAVSALLASRKGRGTGNWFVLGFLFSIIAIIFLLVLKPIEKNIAKKENLVKCPKCAEWIKQEAVVCKHCGFEFDSADAEPEMEEDIDVEPLEESKDKGIAGSVSLAVLATGAVIVAIGIATR